MGDSGGLKNIFFFFFMGNIYVGVLQFFVMNLRISVIFDRGCRYVLQTVITYIIDEVYFGFRGVTICVG